METKVSDDTWYTCKVQWTECDEHPRLCHEFWGDCIKEHRAKEIEHEEKTGEKPIKNRSFVRAV